MINASFKEMEEEKQGHSFPRYQYFRNVKNGRVVLGNEYQKNNFERLGLVPCDPPEGAMEILKSGRKKLAQPTGVRGIDMSDEGESSGVSSERVAEMLDAMKAVQEANVMLQETNVELQKQVAAQQEEISKLSTPADPPAAKSGSRRKSTDSE